MENNFKSYFLVAMIFCISVVSIGTSLFLLNGNSFSLLKKRMGASIVDAVPSESLITDVEFYAELVDSYNAEKGTSYDYTHNFTESELASLNTLIIDENGPNYHGHAVADLSGLRYLTGLENISLQNINVELIDLSYNTNLVSVDINDLSLNKLVLLNNSKLTSLNTNKPTNPGYIATERNHSISYLFGQSIGQSETLENNGFVITCDKYNLSIGETTNCMVKGKTDAQMNAIIFKLLKSNENIAISDENLEVNLTDELHYQPYGDVPIGEFNILSFKVTAVSAGISKVYLDDYSENNPKGYVDTVEYDFVPYANEVSKIFYVDKYNVTDKIGNVVTTGLLQTNYSLNIIDENGIYNKGYDIAVLGDVKADGVIDIRDVAKAYDALAKGRYNSYTETEKVALDRNNDGKKTILDIVKIYKDIVE